MKERPQTVPRGEPGWVIYCSLCDAPAFRLRLFVQDGDRCHAETVEHIDGRPCVDGDVIACPACRTNFDGVDLDRGLVHR